MTPGQEKIRLWRHEPERFAWDNFKLELDPWQKEGLKPAGGPPNPRRRIGFRAMTGPGKTTELAILGWHRLSCFAELGEHPKGAALSGEGKDNLSDNLWPELAKLQERSEFLKAAFTWNSEAIYANDHSQTWFLSARSYPKDADVQAIGRSLSGLHSRYPFVLLDEIGDMPITVGQKAEQIFTGQVADALIAAAGNPTSLTGLLYHISTIVRSLWSIVTIIGDPEDPKAWFYAPRFGPEAAQHAREQIRLYGRDNPWVKSTILGEFPDQGFNTLLGVDEVERAMRRHHKEDVYSHAQKRLGVDVARFGSDRTVIFPRQGLASFKPVIMRGARSTEVAARVAAAKAKWGSEYEFVDGTGGYGAGVVDALTQAGHTPIEVNFSAQAPDVRFFNLRSYIWWQMAEWVKKGGALPPIPELVAELTAPTYSFQGGRIRLEEKEQIKKRLQFSPDIGDSLAVTFALPDMPAQLPYPLNLTEGRGALKTEFDPYRDA